MQYGMIRKTVSFNLNDPQERAMYELISSPNVNFSRIVKQFLAAQLHARATHAQTITTTSQNTHAATQQKSDPR